jgi:hypothetical protein
MKKLISVVCCLAFVFMGLNVVGQVCAQELVNATPKKPEVRWLFWHQLTDSEYVDQRGDNVGLFKMFVWFESLDMGFEPVKVQLWLNGNLASEDMRILRWRVHQYPREYFFDYLGTYKVELKIFYTAKHFFSFKKTLTVSPYVPSFCFDCGLSEKQGKIRFDVTPILGSPLPKKIKVRIDNWDMLTGEHVYRYHFGEYGQLYEVVLPPEKNNWLEERIYKGVELNTDFFIGIQTISVVCRYQEEY